MTEKNAIEKTGWKYTPLQEAIFNIANEEHNLPLTQCECDAFIHTIMKDHIIIPKSEVPEDLLETIGVCVVDPNMFEDCLRAHNARYRTARLVAKHMEGTEK